MIKLNSVGFVIYLMVGLYFINSAFNFIPIPEIVLGIQKWIFLLGGALIIFAGIKLLTKKRMPLIR